MSHWWTPACQQSLVSSGFADSSCTLLPAAQHRNPFPAWWWCSCLQCSCCLPVPWVAALSSITVETTVTNPPDPSKNELQHTAGYAGVEQYYPSLHWAVTHWLLQHCLYYKLEQQRDNCCHGNLTWWPFLVGLLLLEYRQSWGSTTRGWSTICIELPHKSADCQC